MHKKAVFLQKNLLRRGLGNHGADALAAEGHHDVGLREHIVRCIAAVVERRLRVVIVLGDEHFGHTGKAHVKRRMEAPRHKARELQAARRPVRQPRLGCHQQGGNDHLDCRLRRYGILDRRRGALRRKAQRLLSILSKINPRRLLRNEQKKRFG